MLAENRSIRMAILISVHFSVRGEIFKTEQKLLFGNGTVEQHDEFMEKTMQLFEALFERPIIGHLGWEDSITDEQKVRIKIERLVQIKISGDKGEKIEMATDYEAMVYLMTTSLSQPLSSMWTRIYFSLFKKYYPDKSEFIDDREAHMDLQAEAELRTLKRWLLRQSRKK